MVTAAVTFQADVGRAAVGRAANSSTERRLGSDRTRRGSDPDVQPHLCRPGCDGQANQAVLHAEHLDRSEHWNRHNGCGQLGQTDSFYATIRSMVRILPS